MLTVFIKEKKEAIKPVSSPIRTIVQFEHDEPVGALARIYCMKSLPLSERLAIMEMIERMPPTERARVEALVSVRPRILANVVRMVKDVEREVKKGDLSTLRLIAMLYSVNPITSKK